MEMAFIPLQHLLTIGGEEISAATLDLSFIQGTTMACLFRIEEKFSILQITAPKFQGWMVKHHRLLLHPIISFIAMAAHMGA
ncbi:MAG: hypothetical protein RSC68_10530, partial [Acinetobacter sp.]